MAELPFPLGAARRRWRVVVPCSSQRWLCRVPLGGVGVVPCSSQRRLCRVPLGGVGVVPCSSQRRLLGLPSAALCRALPFPNGGSWDSHPRARLGCAFLLPKVALALPSGAGRGLRWLLVRVPLLRTICGHSANDGGDAGGDAAQNRARCLAATSLRSCARPSVCATSLRIAALRLIYGAFAAGVAPDPMKSGQPRAQPTVRAAFGYSRGDWDSTRTLRGRFARAARIGLAPVRARVGHLQGRCGDGASGAVGV